MKTAYLVTRYSIEKEKFVSCEIWSMTPWESSYIQPGELWSVIYSFQHETFQKAIDSILRIISEGYYPKQWDSVLCLLRDSDKKRIEELKNEIARTKPR